MLWVLSQEIGSIKLLALILIRITPLMHDPLSCCPKLLVILTYKTDVMRKEMDLSENIKFLLQSLVFHTPGNVGNLEKIHYCFH